MILVRRYSVKDGHQLKRPTKTSLFRFLHDNQIGDSPRLKIPKKELCQDCKQAEVTCECLECGMKLCEFCFNESHMNGICKSNGNVEVSYDDYNDYCSECEEHDKCHKNGIDYDKIASCKSEIKENENLPCGECTEPLPCNAETLEECKKKRGVEKEG